MLRWWLFLLAPVFAVLVSGSVLAAGDPAAGKQKSQACAACHGPDGNSPAPQFPKLAGQYAGYLVHALTAYQVGDRTDPVMQPMAASLSEQDKEDLAAYYASQTGLTLPWKTGR
ncbi:c-type cytochrome [Nitrosococcus oceani]|uniref:Cytochrome c, class I n=2 Tax=Nitrosococcus oceani TaxID=1229 RepID=Q3J6Q6_NITOC|nr:cytochrome c [Nitrosococcus oceani]ABA59490.1 Cytochrome c, class I [Nitrosococcus oceani ATCC 19707]KFI18056.1 cytochrome C [Nitrosococcus oceani C-27]KFI21295.1 cytochrome C [Nitrosococcus oceani]GEM21383.1 cytochrome c [Nitrosococcus oceani]